MPPIKRHEALVRFSREHFFGLLLGWKVKQGVSKNVETERIANYIIAASKAEVMPHFENEEKELFVLLPEADPMRIQAEAEHFSIRQKLKALDGDATIENLTDFAKMIETHIRFEERLLFPYIEKQQSFEAFAKAMESHNAAPHEDFDPTWEDHFWK